LLFDGNFYIIFVIIINNTLIVITMPELIDSIKDVAGKVADSYLLKKEDMNNAILKYHENSKCNDEILKRICEFCNNQVYLSLFNKSSVNRANIEFDMADYDKIKNTINERGSAMNDYNSIPNDYKGKIKITTLELDSDKVPEDIDKEINRVKDLEKKFNLKETLKQILMGMETMKTAEFRNAEDSFSTIFSDCKHIVANGESIGDMAKIAMRYSKDNELDMMKIAKVYEVVNDELKNSGFNVKEDITKISSMPLDNKSDLLKPVKEYQMSLLKIAAINEFNHNLKKTIELCDYKIKEIKSSK